MQGLITCSETDDSGPYLLALMRKRNPPPTTPQNNPHLDVVCGPRYGVSVVRDLMTSTIRYNYSCFFERPDLNYGHLKNKNGQKSFHFPLAQNFIWPEKT